MKYVLLLLLCSGCATTDPMKLYKKHQDAGYEEADKFRTQEFKDLEAICLQHPERCGPATLVVKDCKTVKYDESSEDQATWCVNTKRSRVIMQKFWSVDNDREFEEMSQK